MTWQNKVKELFGYRYRSILANIAKVNKRTVERWDRGEYKINKEVVDKINRMYDIWRK